MFYLAIVPIGNYHFNNYVSQNQQLIPWRKQGENVSRSVVSNSLQPPWTVARQAPLSMGFSRQEYWSGLPFHSPGDHPNPGIKPGSSALQVDSLASEPPVKLTLEKEILQINLFPFIEFPSPFELCIIKCDYQPAALKPHGFQTNEAPKEWWIESNWNHLTSENVLWPLIPKLGFILAWIWL